MYDFDENIENSNYNSIRLQTTAHKTNKKVVQKKCQFETQLAETYDASWKTVSIYSTYSSRG